MRKAGLPLQRLLTLEHLTAVAGLFKLADVSAPVRGGGGGARRRPGGGQPADHASRAARDAAADETSEDRVVTGRQRRKRRGSRRRSARGRRDATCWSSWRSAARRCPATRSWASSPRAPGSRCTATDCANAASLRSEPERLVGVEWAPTAKSSFLVAIQVEALDRNRLLSDITRALSDQHVNILSAALNTSQGPDLQGPVHLRDRRPHPSGPRLARGPRRAGRLRRLSDPAIGPALASLS